MPGGEASNPVFTRQEKNALVFRARLHKSANVHFRLTFKVKDVSAKGVIRTEVRYTPPITLTVGITAAQASGKGFYDAAGGGPVARSAAPAMPVNPEPVDEIAPPVPRLPVREVGRTARRSEPDFSTDLFPPLPAK